MPFTRIENTIAAVGRGEIVVVVDDEDRENEGDLIMAAEKITPETMGFMVRHTSGVICMPMMGERLDELQIPLMVSNNTESQRTTFTVSCDARAGTTTGISAADRATTVRTLIDPTSRADDVVRPGHIFPLRYREGGVLKRAGHTEAAVDLARLSGLAPAGVLAELVNDDGTMARLPQLEVFAAEHGLQLITIADLIRFRRHREKLVPARVRGAHPHEVRRLHRVRLREPPRRRRAHGIRTGRGVGSVERARPRALRVSDRRRVRIHSLRLRTPARSGARADRGCRRGRGGVPPRSRRAWHRSRPQAPCVHAAGPGSRHRAGERGPRVPGRLAEYGIGSQILVDLGITTMRLMTNNPAKYGGLEGFGLEIVERVSVSVAPNDENIAYLRAKQQKMGHLLDIEDEGLGGS